MKPGALLSALLGWAMLWTASVEAAQKETALQSNEDGEITLTQPTQAGNLTLHPGAYVLRGHVSGERHFIRFTEVERSQEFRATRIFTGWYTDTRAYKAGDVECRLEPLGATVQVTEATIANEDGTPRITQVMVKGKAVVCIF